jgi:thioesterase domain-containing protein
LSTAEFLNELRSLDVRIEAVGDRLRFNAPAGVLTAELRARITVRKLEILEFLNRVATLERQQPAIVPLNSLGTQTPIFAVPGHNGDVFCYRALSTHLGADQPFHGLQPPGYDGVSEPIRSVHRLAGYFAEQIRATRPQGPVIIAGFCAGGGIALELACQLQESGQTVSMLVLFASPFPKAYRFWSMVRIRSGNALERVRVHWRELRAMAPAGMLRYVAGRIRALAGGKPHLREEAERAVTDPLYRSRKQLEETTIRALAEYEPRRFAGPGILFLPSAQWRRIGDNSRRWATVVSEYSEHIGPEGCTGDNILLEPHVRRTAAEFTLRRPDRRPAIATNGP